MKRNDPYKKWVKALMQSWDSDVEVRLLEQKEQALPILKQAFLAHKKSQEKSRAFIAFTAIGTMAIMSGYIDWGLGNLVWLLLGFIISALLLYSKRIWNGFQHRPQHTKQFVAHIASVTTQIPGQAKMELLLEILQHSSYELPVEILNRVLFALDNCFQNLDQEQYNSLSQNHRQMIRDLLRIGSQITLEQGKPEYTKNPLFQYDNYGILAFTLAKVYQRVGDAHVLKVAQSLLKIPSAPEDQNSVALKLELTKAEQYIQEVLRAQAPHKDLLRAASYKPTEQSELLRPSKATPPESSELLLRVAPSHSNTEESLSQVIKTTPQESTDLPLSLSHSPDDSK